MDPKNLTTVSALIGYVIFAYALFFKGEKSSFVAWGLWTIIDVIVLNSLIKTHQNTDLAWVFTIGTGLIALILLLKRDFKWSVTEKFITALTCVCIAIYFLAEKNIAITAGSIAVFISGIPNLIYMKNNKIKSYTAIVCCLMLIASGISFVSTIIQSDEWTNNAFPAICTLYWSIATIIATYKTMNVRIYGYES